MEINFKCLIVGHKPFEDYTDSGYEICQRCSAHEYHDGVEREWNNEFNIWDNTIPSIYSRRKFIIRQRVLGIKEWFYTKCSCCDKPTRVFGKYKHEGHEDCLPF